MSDYTYVENDVGVSAEELAVVLLWPVGHLELLEYSTKQYQYSAKNVYVLHKKY